MSGPRRPTTTLSARAMAGAMVWALAGCAATPMHVAALDDVEHARAGAGVQEGAHLAPEAYARAEQERRIALEEHAAGDDVGAVLHAQRALAAYDHALTVVRLARATAELADAQKALDDATTQVQAIEGSRAQLEHEASHLEDQLRLSRERLLPAASGPATPEREAARLSAARSLALEGRLLCDAARLVAADAQGLAEADGELGQVDRRLGQRSATAIDDAARARSRCLDVLTRARRASGDDAGSSDALLSELSAAGGWDPVRDERGVVVTLHDAFRGAEISADAGKKLRDLGRVAAAHPGFALQVVVHDAQAPAREEGDAKRAGAAVEALVAGGAVSGHIKPELAGTRAPLVEPRDASQRARNERLDVVFVASGRPAAAIK